MTVNRFIRNLLNLKELAVTHFELDDRRPNFKPVG